MAKIQFLHYVLNLRTNHQWRQFKFRDEVPKKVLADQFNYQDPNETTDGFFCYHDTWYHLDQFERVEPEGDFAKLGWGGICHESASSGVVIKISDDHETYQIASYYTSAE